MKNLMVSIILGIFVMAFVASSLVTSAYASNCIITCKLNSCLMKECCWTTKGKSGIWTYECEYTGDYCPVGSDCWDYVE